MKKPHKPLLCFPPKTVTPNSTRKQYPTRFYIHVSCAGVHTSSYRLRCVVVSCDGQKVVRHKKHTADSGFWAFGYLYSGTQSLKGEMKHKHSMHHFMRLYCSYLLTHTSYLQPHFRSFVLFR